MNDWFQAIGLAFIQGLTEFLPISSSAHLLFPTLLLGWDDQGVAFDVAVHFGTLLAVLWYFRTDLWRLTGGLGGFLRGQVESSESREILYLAIATVPAVVAGFLLNDAVDKLRSLPVIASSTIVFALVLAWADRRGVSSRRTEVPGMMAALFIGLAQALALIPGTSRSGITLSAALFLGLSRQAAARFSFLLSIPVISGAALLKSVELVESGVSVDWGMLTLAAGLAGVVAYLTIAWFIALVNRIGMMPFVLYRLVLGVALFGVLYL
ncbi:MAG: undecaprenyl-diphosphate phosphatase [Pseudomonadota bacterium]